MVTSTQTFSVPAISCEHCVAAITGEVTQVAGVESVHVDTDTKTVVVQGGDPTAIVQAIDDAGYDVEQGSARIAATSEVQLDDGVVRVTRWTFPPGSETGAHVHAFDYVVIPVTTGDLTIESDGPTITAPITLGVAYQRGKGVAHNVANDSEATISFVEVELLEQ